MSDYVSRLAGERRHAAELAERHALAVLDGNRDAIEGMHFYGNMRDALDRQIDWINRRTASAWPTAPAWCD